MVATTLFHCHLFSEADMAVRMGLGAEVRPKAISTPAYLRSSAEFLAAVERLHEAEQFAGAAGAAGAPTPVSLPACFAASA